MKQILTFLPAFLFILMTENMLLKKQQFLYETNKFELHFVTIGFGSNMFEMESIFRVAGTKFIYTSEEVWGLPGQKLQKDTILQGNFRQSSIDSILNLILTIKDTLVYRTNLHVMSGSAASITIKNDKKKIRFNLHNASDTTADKILVILNSYIPNGVDKLFISNFKNKQN